MITIIQQPKPFSFSLELDDLIVQTDEEALSVQLYAGSDLLINEQFNPGVEGERITVKYSKLIHQLLKVELPSFNQKVFVQHKAIKSFKILIQSAIEINFTVIKGFRTQLSYDIQKYLGSSWLTRMPTRSTHGYHGPLFLSTYPLQTISVMAKATFENGESSVLKLYSLEPAKMQVVNLNLGVLCGKFQREFSYIDVYATSESETEILPKMRFYLSPYSGSSQDVVVYENRLGGIDCFKLGGKSKSKYSAEKSNALISDLNESYFSKNTLERSINSGFLTSKEHANQAVDMISSEQLYLVENGLFNKIILANPKMELNKDELHSFDIEFSYADALLNNPTTNYIPTYLNI
ncbi:hypothetical protein J5U18_12795 [Sphingobacteriaceae bacterium WQ 2009]|uniref:Uncharacterized protein n=1 Tax=Rhinopithecimicrobium faecis TaxID=2820698 RepID=A0A8T4HBU9_9SPHI|nr:hypothetical protein [Sphingobacteriaceae bacterium WQ 2009]